MLHAIDVPADRVPDPIKLDPDGIYDDDSLYGTLGISPRTLSKARGNGQLRYSRKGQCTLYVGRWVIDWILADGSHATGDSRRREGVPA